MDPEIEIKACGLCGEFLGSHVRILLTRNYHIVERARPVITSSLMKVGDLKIVQIGAKKRNLDFVENSG